MLTFKQYIAETILNEKGNLQVNADFIYQKVLDALDHAHIDFGEDEIAFHIGKIIKNSNIDISMVIRPGGHDDVRLGKNKETGALTIVVDTRSALPDRDKIDSFLGSDRGRAMKIKKGIVDYLKDHRGGGEAPTRTKYEEEADTNTNIEDGYERLVKELNSRIVDFKGMIEELKGDMDTEDAGKQETARGAMAHLAKEQFGENSEEFKKIALGLLGNVKLVNKENKDKLANRLDSFYDQKIKPLLNK